MTPTVKITLQHTSGAVSAYNPREHEEGGIREAIVTCFARHGADPVRRVELLRSDIPGADWSILAGARAVAELEARLIAAANDLIDGHDPHVVVTLGADRALSNARLVTNSAALESELKDPSNRSMVVPRILPYQLGGSADGATAVIYSPEAGGGLRLHSMHPSDQEALLAQEQLRQSGQAKSCGTLKVTTTVTALIAQVARGEFKATALATAATPISKSGTEPVQRAGLGQSPLRPPATMTPFQSV
jgi:hypothetical protein